MRQPVLLLSTLTLVLTLSAAQAAPSAQTPEDPWRWLEDIDGQRALDWVRERNAVTVRELEALPGFAERRQRLGAIYDSDARIPEVEQLGAQLYNFWRDADHPRGLWRRTTRAEYRKPDPTWETVLDLDALAAAENENWVWKGAECHRPDDRHCLLRLSRGGADAHVLREFDLVTRRFVEDRGFVLPEAKHEVAWANADTLLIATDTGPGSLTTSGYPRRVLRWSRGTALDRAPTVFEAAPSDVAAGIEVFPQGARTRVVFARVVSFFRYRYFLQAGPHLAPLAVPEDADLALFDDQLLLQLRRDWRPLAGTAYSAGSLLAMPLVAFIEGRRDFEVLFTPGPQLSLDSYHRTRNGLLLNLLDRVRGRVLALRREADGWQRQSLAVPDLARVRAFGVDPHGADDYFLTVEHYLQPTQLFEGRLGSAPDPAPIKQLPAFFDTTGLQVTQHRVRSRDGTEVPYFQVGPTAGDGQTPRPTLLYGYGGFEIALKPAYTPGVGAGWLETGGVYVVANIRGGGEFGPPWHQAALREKRQNAYDDFIAVAADLVRRGVTTADRLGIHGGSNGGLLVAAAMTQRPDLFGAVVCRVPLLDMRRYHRLLAGASWVSEYGNPDDPGDWAFLSRYSPYHNLHPDRDYPPILLMTSTRDDRVHPGHARKFAARLGSLDQPVRYYENIEGGHGGAANNAQRAYMDALAYAFLWNRLRPED